MQGSFNSNKLSDKYLHYIILSGIIILTLIIYLVTLKNGFTNWDDNILITDNRDIKDLSFSGIVKIFSSFYQHAYDPLRIISYSFIYYFFGLSPAAFHSANILFHLINIILVYVFIYQLTSPQSTDHSQLTTNQQKTNNEQRITISAFVASLFAVHPMHSEAVCWISALCDPQYSIFYLASLIFYLKYLQQPTVQSPQSIDRGKRSEVRSQKKNYLIALLLFVCSCLSKSAAVTLPVILILLDYYLNSSKFKVQSLKYWLDKIPFFILALAIGIIAIISEKFTGSPNKVIVIQYSLFNRIFILTYSISFYIINLIVPLKLSAFHPSPEIVNGFLPVRYYLSLIFIVLIILLILKAKKRRKEIIFGTLFFLFTISVTLMAGRIRYVQVAERYTYLPYLGLLFIIGQYSINSLQFKIYNFKLIIAMVFILIFSFISYTRSKVWNNSIVLSSDVIEKYPRSYLAYEYRGDAKAKLGDKQGAIQDYSRAIDINPEYTEAFNNRGLEKFTLGDILGALNDFSKAIENNPLNADAFLNRGNAKGSIDDKKGALNDYNKAIELNPGNAQAFNNRGLIRFNLDDKQGALKDFNKAIEINPQYAYAFVNRGSARYFLSDKEGACNDWVKSAELGYKQANDMIIRYCK
jgi:protein O-mannosyl-transferase